MLGTRNLKMAELGNMSLEDYYTNLIGKVAAGGNNIQALVDINPRTCYTQEVKKHNN